MPRIDTLLEQLVAARGSDLHLSAGAAPMVRVSGSMRAVSGAALSADAARAVIEEIIPESLSEEFGRTHDIDFAYQTSGRGRFRVNVFRDRRGMGAVLRHIPQDIPSIESLNLPPVIKNFAEQPRGIILVTGPTGSGKSTTLASIIDAINTQRSDHIITLEDPIEFVHENKKSLVNQREIGVHTESFAAALRAALREDPDVILVGEMRDLETTAMAIEAAETGHLVFSTLHTSSAASTVSRIIDQFPAGQQAQIRMQLAASLQGVVSQCLLKRKDGQGRVAALEVLVATSAISAMIREGKTHQITSAMQTGGRQGMTLLNDSLVRLASRGTIEPEDGYNKASDKEGLLRAYQVAGVRFTPQAAGSAPQELKKTLVRS